MEVKQSILFEKKLAVSHRAILLAIILYSFVEYMVRDKMICNYVLLFILAIVLVDIAIFYKPISQIVVISVYRYIQFILILLFMNHVRTESVYLFTILNGFLLLTIIELFIAMNHIDKYVPILSNLLILVPCFFIPALEFARISPVKGMGYYYILISLDVICLHMIITALLNHMKKTEETILSQSRMIENIEEFNQSLVQEEEKVRHANDELAKQKNELMAAKHQTEKMNTEMLIQNEIVKYISSSLEIDRLMAMIADSLIGALGANIAAIVLYPGATDNNESKSNIRTTNSQEFQTLFSNYVLAGCLNQYIQNNRTFVDNEVDEARYDFLQNSKVGSMVIIPLIKGEARIGALCVGHPNHDYFDENTQLRFFESIVAQFLIALENANLYMRMEKLATKDGLTGVYNRGYLTKLLKEALNDAVLNQTSISLALFDIDHFKLVNDTYGHLTGDEVIKVLAGIAMEIAAKNFGLVGRFGGEEFVILFPEKTIDQSIKPVEKLRSLLKEASVEHNGKKVNITISVGLTCYPETCSNPQELLNHADWAMYYSKQNGRDQITIDNDTVQKLVKMQ